MRFMMIYDRPPKWNELRGWERVTDLFTADSWEEAEGRRTRIAEECKMSREFVYLEKVGQ